MNGFVGCTDLVMKVKPSTGVLDSRTYKSIESIKKNMVWRNFATSLLQPKTGSATISYPNEHAHRTLRYGIRVSRKLGATKQLNVYCLFNL